jgi:FMN-dependent NADH-azoreductase
MTRVLYIEASPRKQLSASIEVAQAALAALRDSIPDIVIDKLDVWNENLPHFDGPVMEAKYAGISGVPLTGEQAEAWAAIRALAARFRNTDYIVIAAPLWNFGIPYRLKQLIDAVTQKDLLFSFDARGLVGLLDGTKALLICARGLDYGPGSATPAASFDFQQPYLACWLRFIGISEIETIIVEKTLFEAEIGDEARKAASRAAQKAATQLAMAAT